ncbi:glutamine synthetase family protein [Stigmatella aurantiaca]|uniref:Glutamine synthetase n=1 Tax=Stigmatella aurantiaca (strain DW4/3-1) TaxID=378806 RepID=E3FSW3_STIAD|nr:glutamine synthetase family protein [Stigmatella aurantiaca]ADO74587.1 Glutamine synthetase [Stigmatella aurantiaca DW4/3-1]
MSLFDGVGSGEHLLMLACNDLSGMTRGRAVPVRERDAYLQRGVGWVPADQALTPFDVIASPNPWGSTGDLRLKPDPAAEVRINLWPDVTPLQYALCDIIHTDGTPWDSCTRTYLRTALAELESETGLRLMAAFEHEFTLVGQEPPGPAFSLRAFRSEERLGNQIMAALEQAQQQPEMFLPEYGAGQFEVLCKPTAALAAADRAVFVRDICREVAARLGKRITFSPKLTPQGVGNGVHIHFSLWDRENRPVTYDPKGPGGLSQVAGRFAAGVVAHLPALCALTAPSVVSYLRLMPHHWSSAYTCLGHRNREAALRICPVEDRPGVDVSRQFNVEYRPADATACPYIALGALVRAGLDGIRRELAIPPLVNGDPSEMSEAERERAGAHRLPASLPEALSALEADATLRGGFSNDLLACYLSLKRTEMKVLDGLDPAAVCRRYAECY